MDDTYIYTFMRITYVEILCNIKLTNNSILNLYG